ncbi:MFS transporter [Marinitenerispora sediminis]|uniref:MFS transporter n=1 Tax=Marinitenerispora sediminis TaxID=1931232 RepID=A0A368TA87_9ACTN|nr:MFS transporter [Marinitenerispora sediminis]RCV53386.1 MFS transporter [Marinitenerispora sediminis]RCV58418.1 MFS transporter [Marinitenerispora sediminis]RCV61801.1 MFS transporter [Marinitenerispora sediminis]
MASAPAAAPGTAARWRVWPLYAAGFTTAFGAHGIAANLGEFTQDRFASLLVLGALLAVYDGAEVLLKPLFGALADRVGARPVLLGGLLGFAAASAAFLLVSAAGAPGAALWLARLGQGAAASAFSPAASTLVARLSPRGGRGRAFGSYGFHKSLGYTLGPLLGGLLMALGGMAALFAVMAVLAFAVAVWAAAVVPAVPPLPRTRQTVLDLARRLGQGWFLRPTVALAAATAALSVGVGFLPVSGAAAGLGTVATGAAVSVLAACGALVQPLAGRALDAGRISAPAGLATGLLVTAAGLAAALIPGLAGVLLAAVAIGAGTGLITPVAFAVLAADAPEERMGQVMGSAELGRELGDAGGPLLVAGVATATALSGGFATLALLLALAPLMLVRWRLTARPDAPGGATDGAAGRGTRPAG